jgi:hypothetical protein
LNLGGGEKALTPTFEMLASGDELTVKNMVRVHMPSLFVPSLLDNFEESQHAGPEVLESKGMGSLGTAATSEEEGAMIGEGGGERVKDVLVMRGIPLLVAKEGVDH